MLDKSDLEMNDLLTNFQLQPKSESSSPSMVTELNKAIVALQDNDQVIFDGDRVTVLVLQALVILLERTAPPTAKIPAMSEHDAWEYDSMVCGSEPYDSNS